MDKKLRFRPDGESKFAQTPDLQRKAFLMQQKAYNSWGITLDIRY